MRLGERGDSDEPRVSPAQQTIALDGSARGAGDLPPGLAPERHGDLRFCPAQSVDVRGASIAADELRLLPRRPFGTSPAPLVAGERWLEEHEDGIFLVECSRTPDDEHTRDGVALRRHTIRAV